MADLRVPEGNRAPFPPQNVNHVHVSTTLALHLVFVHPYNLHILHYFTLQSNYGKFDKSAPNLFSQHPHTSSSKRFKQRAEALSTSSIFFFHINSIKLTSTLKHSKILLEIFISSFLVNIHSSTEKIDENLPQYK